MVPHLIRSVVAAIVVFLMADPVEAQEVSQDFAHETSVEAVDVLPGGLLRISYRTGLEQRQIEVPAAAITQLVRHMESVGDGPATVPPAAPPALPLDSTRGTRVVSTGKMYSRTTGTTYATTIVPDSIVTLRYREAGVDRSISLPPDVFALVDRVHRGLTARSQSSAAEFSFDPSSGIFYMNFARGFDYRVVLAVFAILLGVIVAILVRVSVWRVKRERDELLASRRYMAQIRESERSHLASELHDGPIQDLQRILRTYVGHLSHLTADEQKAKLAEIELDLRDVAGELRDICSDLKPPILVHFGLARAVEAFTRDFQARNPSIAVDLDMGADSDTLSMEIRLVLYRILQEALTNVEKHASAEHVWITLRRNDGMANLTVDDDGQGFKLPSRLMKFEQTGHFGLSGMLQRAQAVGGRLDVTSRPGDGTQISVQVPYIPVTGAQEALPVEEKA